MSDHYGRIDRTRDVYRVHDTAKKQKKDRKGQSEKEFLDMLEESKRQAGEFEPEKEHKQPKRHAPTSSMLNNLSTSAPPPMIESENGNDSEKEETGKETDRK